MTWMVVSMFALFSCRPEDIPGEETIDPFVYVQAKNITKTSATLSAQVTPNGDNVTLSFQYALENSDEWICDTLEEKLSGVNSVIKSVEIQDLQPNTAYKYKVSADKTSSAVKYFTTGNFSKATIVVSPAENIKITTAHVKALLVPGVDGEVSVSFKYSEASSSKWQTITLPDKFIGTDTVKLTFDLYELKPNTEYNFCWEATNKGGTESKTITFGTYAVVDYDGNYYHTVTIGDQTWLKENLETTHFANGDPITNVTSSAVWKTLTTGAYCWYNNDPKIGETYGALYNWYLATDSRELIVGYKTPTADDFVSLAFYLGYNDGSFGPLLMETGTSHWINPVIKATNSTGLTVLPNGVRGYISGSFTTIGESSSLWTSSEYGDSAELLEISNINCILNIGPLYPKVMGGGIRLLKNS